MNTSDFEHFMDKKCFDEYTNNNKRYSITEINSGSHKYHTLDIIFPYYTSNSYAAYISYNIDLDYIKSLTSCDILIYSSEDKEPIYASCGNKSDYNKIYTTNLFDIDGLGLVMSNRSSTMPVPFNSLIYVFLY